MLAEKWRLGEVAHFPIEAIFLYPALAAFQAQATKGCMSDVVMTSLHSSVLPAWARSSALVCGSAHSRVRTSVGSRVNYVL